MAAALLAPTAARASGGDALSLLWLEVLLLVAVLGSVAFGRLNMKGRWLVVTAYLFGVLSPLLVTASWPYRDNAATINALCFGVPLVLWLVAFACARIRLRQA